MFFKSQKFWKTRLKNLSVWKTTNKSDTTDKTIKSPKEPKGTLLQVYSLVSIISTASIISTVLKIFWMALLKYQYKGNFYVHYRYKYWLYYKYCLIFIGQIDFLQMQFQHLIAHFSYFVEIFWRKTAKSLQFPDIIC